MNAVDRFLGMFADLWAQEPVLVTAAVTAVIDLLVSFGVQIDEGQKTAIIAVITTVGAVLARSQVSPARPVPPPVVQPPVTWTVTAP